MLIKKIVVGPLESNCYLAGDNDTKEIFIIDPGGDYKRIKSVIDKNSLKPKAVINTHGHGDHIGANKEFNIPWIADYRDGWNTSEIDNKEEIIDAIGDLMIYCFGLYEMLGVNSDDVLKKIIENNRTRTHSAKI